MTDRLPILSEASTRARRRPDAGGRACRSAVIAAGALLLLLAWWPPRVRAIDYQPPPFVVRFALSDLAVAGTVREVGQESLRLEISRVLRGAAPESFLTVRHIEGWPAARGRRIPYAPGQEFVLFLMAVAEPEGETAWRILGLESEGELPIKGEHVYLPGRPTSFLESRTYCLHGDRRQAQRYPLETFLAALEEYSSCFTWHLPANRERPPTAERTCTDAELEAYRSRSSMHEYLSAETLARLPRP